MAKINDKKSYKLSIYLLKKEVKNYHAALKSNVNIQQEFDFKKEIGASGKVIIGETSLNNSPWRDLLQEGVSPTLPSLINSSNRAIVFFLIEGRIFVIVFGYGKHLLKDEAIDRDFGLRTVLNIVNPDKLLSIDKANLDELTVLTRTQASLKSTPETFNIDIIKDLLKGITGEPFENYTINFGKIITGGESICIIPKVSFKDISVNLKELKHAYESNRYKTRFGWIDNLKHEQDPLVIEDLEENLVKDLMNKEKSNISLAPPFLMDWESFEGFSYTPKGDLQTEFEITNFYEQKSTVLKDLTWEKISSLYIYFKYGNQDERTYIPFWRCLNYQTELNNCIYVFALSKWYKVNKSYVREITDYVNKIKESDLSFIDCTKGMNEGAYNIALANSQPYFRLLDKKLIKTDLTRSEIEACDVLSESMEFIHIKFRHSSATLSHLFAQGKISAFALRKDKTYRANLRKRFKEVGLKSDSVPIEGNKLKTSRFTITFGLIEKDSRSFVESLPFFSLLNFRLTAEELLLLGYDVRVKKINIV